MYVVLVAALVAGLSTTLLSVGRRALMRYNYRETVSPWFRSTLLLLAQDGRDGGSSARLPDPCADRLLLFTIWPFTRLVHAFTASRCTTSSAPTSSTAAGTSILRPGAAPTHRGWAPVGTRDRDAATPEKSACALRQAQGTSIQKGPLVTSTAPSATTLQTGQTKNLVLALLAFTITFWAWNLIGPLGTALQPPSSILAPTQKSLLVAMPVLVGSLGRIATGALDRPLRWPADVHRAHPGVRSSACCSLRSRAR